MSMARYPRTREVMGQGSAAGAGGAACVLVVAAGMAGAAVASIVVAASVLVGSFRSSLSPSSTCDRRRVSWASGEKSGARREQPQLRSGRAPRPGL